MRFTRHQLRQATAKAHKKAGHIKKSTILLTFILGYLVGLGTLQIIDLATDTKKPRLFPTEAFDLKDDGFLTVPITN